MCRLFPTDECVNSLRSSTTLRPLPSARQFVPDLRGGCIEIGESPHSRADGHSTVTVQWEGLTQTSHVTMMDAEDLHGEWIRDLLKINSKHTFCLVIFSDQKFARPKSAHVKLSRDFTNFAVSTYFHLLSIVCAHAFE